ncbi:MAG TPA: hypothetical protein VGC07_04130, partial [Granulicella sp.]
MPLRPSGAASARGASLPPCAQHRAIRRPRRTDKLVTTRMPTYVTALAIAYLLGSIPSGYLLVRT